MEERKINLFDIVFTVFIAVMLVGAMAGSVMLANLFSFVAVVVSLFVLCVTIFAYTGDPDDVLKVVEVKSTPRWLRRIVLIEWIAATIIVAALGMFVTATATMALIMCAICLRTKVLDLRNIKEEEAKGRRPV